MNAIISLYHPGRGVQHPLCGQKEGSTSCVLPQVYRSVQEETTIRSVTTGKRCVLT